jgi:predicted adenine nucleotide alpha hydrolase (AANH) superfamily ATPase
MTETEGQKPRLLLHACCGVCSAYVPELLIPDFDVTVYYENSNIFPQEEYFRRLDAAKTMARKYGLEFIEPAYSPDDWEMAVRGHEQDGENGPRCRLCINFRLDRTFAFARDNGFPWIATTLSVSRRKNTAMINEIGALLADRYGINFLGRDWKKRNGENLSQERAKATGIYRQNYCGCRYSMRHLDK